MKLNLSLLAAAITLSGTLAQAQTPSTLEKAKASGSITVSYREASIPFSYLDDKGQPPVLAGRFVPKW